MRQTTCVSVFLRSLASLVIVMSVLASGCSDDSSDPGGSTRRDLPGRSSSSSPSGPVTRDPAGSGHTTTSSTPSEATNGVQNESMTGGTTVRSIDVVGITPEEVKEEKDPVVLQRVLVEAADVDSRKAAARGLGREAGVSSIPALIEGLHDENITVRVYSISAINDITSMRYRYDPKAPKEIRDDQARKIEEYFRNVGVIK
jgi:hypothetical protein